MTDHRSPVSAREESAASPQSPQRHRWLPPIGSPAHHILLAGVALLILGPLGGISAAYMNFSIGFFIGGQVLAGILGSTVTLSYGPEGKHSANYIQTMAASVAGMSAMAPLIQAMVWLGLPVPPAWQLVLYFMSIGMFGVGIGMLYTPLLVDRMQLTYPSGLAVANILRALTDKALLQRSIAKLGGGMVTGFAGGLASAKVPLLGATGLSAATFGGGMIVGARIALPALVVALIGRWQTPHLVSIGWLQPTDPYRKIGFIISLGAIMGAVMLDLAFLLVQALRRLRETRSEPAPAAPDWKRVNLWRLVWWVLFWGAATVWIGSQLLHQSAFFLLVGVALCFLFVLVNGIALGISDFNPISSAFVMSVFIMAALGLNDPATGLMCAAVLAIATSEGGDMQQDRSTGWRLGTNRVLQFRYQVIGIAGGAVLAVALAKLFLNAYPILTRDLFADPHLEGAQQWQAAFTYKMVGALRGITYEQPHVMKALLLGIVLGLLIEALRKLITKRRRYQTFAANTRLGRTTAFLLDAIFLPSPYACAFGGFVEFVTILWWAAGGLVSLLVQSLQASIFRPPAKPAEGQLPADMGTTSLVGGGLIAGDSLAALSIGVYGLLKTLL